MLRKLLCLLLITFTFSSAVISHSWTTIKLAEPSRLQSAGSSGRQIRVAPTSKILGHPLWPGSRLTGEKRESAVLRGLNFIDRRVAVRRNCRDYGPRYI